MASSSSTIDDDTPINRDLINDNYLMQYSAQFRNDRNQQKRDPKQESQLIRLTVNYSFYLSQLSVEDKKKYLSDFIQKLSHVTLSNFDDHKSSRNISNDYTEEDEAHDMEIFALSSSIGLSIKQKIDYLTEFLNLLREENPDCDFED